MLRNEGFTRWGKIELDDEGEAMAIADGRRKYVRDVPVDARNLPAS
jgi:hypothetical protein